MDGATRRVWNEQDRGAANTRSKKDTQGCRLTVGYEGLLKAAKTRKATVVIIDQLSEEEIDILGSVELHLTK